MQNSTFTSIHSSDLQQLQTLFNSLQKPYGQGEIVRFNLAYKRSYPHLSRHEKRRAEAFADALIADLEREDPVCCPSDS